VHPPQSTEHGSFVHSDLNLQVAREHQPRFSTFQEALRQGEILYTPAYVSLLAQLGNKQYMLMNVQLILLLTGHMVSILEHYFL